MLKVNDRARLVYEALEKIENKKNYRNALLLQLEGCSLEDIQTILEISSIETVKTYLFRAKECLKTLIKEGRI